MWMGLEKVIEDYLGGITIQDLANTGNEADNYVI
jgi:hypothetical protein